MVARVSMTKSRVYADEPQVYIVSGLVDNQYSNYFKFARFRYTYTDGTGGGSVYLNQPGKSYTWASISDSYNFSFDAAELDPNLPLAWNMDQVRQLYAEGASWAILSWNPSTGTMAVYGTPRGVRFPKYRYELHVRSGSSGTSYNHAVEWSVIQENMPESLKAQYLPAEVPVEEPVPIPEPEPIEEPPITIPPDDTLPPIGDPYMPPVSDPGAPTTTILPSIGTGAIILGGALLLGTKSGKKMLRRFKL